MIYGIYKSVRDAAWQCLLDYKISELPVNLLKIAADAGIEVRKDSEVAILTGCESGVAILSDDVWYVVYDDEASIGRRRFTIAHEFGHIFLGHELINSHHGRSFNILKPQVESESDIFASRLLAPACVLWGLNIKSADDIARLCGISMTAARVRAERMEVLYKRGKFLTSPLERRVYKQFEGYINSYRSK